VALREPVLVRACMYCQACESVLMGTVVERVWRTQLDGSR